MMRRSWLWWSRKPYLYHIEEYRILVSVSHRCLPEYAVACVVGRLPISIHIQPSCLW